MLGKLIDSEMCRYPASNDNTVLNWIHKSILEKQIDNVLIDVLKVIFFIVLCTLNDCF
jgi:hypothetical protein